MRNLVCYIATSLDGYIAGPSGEIDWLFSDQDYGYTEFIAEVDTVVMGRKTYELSRSFSEYPYPGTTGYVFSRARHGPDEYVTFVSENPAGFMAGLKETAGKTIWLVGGAEIVVEAVKADLLDNLILSIHPIILGDGIPLFSRGLPKRALQLVETESFTSGLVQLTYERW